MVTGSDHANHPVDALENDDADDLAHHRLKAKDFESGDGSDDDVPELLPPSKFRRDVPKASRQIAHEKALRFKSL